MAEKTKTFYGHRLRIAREFRAMTLKELGEHVSSSSKYLRRLEIETIQPRDDLVLALADVLNVKVSFFYRDVQETENTLFHFRKLKSVSKQAEATAIAHAKIFNDFVQYLEENLEFPAVNIPLKKPDSQNLSSIERIADTCRMHWGLGLDTPITNMCRLLENIGVIVTEFDNITATVDAFSWIGKRPIVVRSALKKSGSRSRFDLAHELGHLVMHAGVLTGDDLTEQQAYRFAGAFLIPQGVFRREFPLSNGLDFPWRSLFALKQRWKVSIQAIIRRAYDLELIGAAGYRRANIYIVKKGWKRSEPYEPEPEIPELIQNAIAAIREGLDIDNTLLAKEIGVDCSDFISCSNSKAC